MKILKIYGIVFLLIFAIFAFIFIPTFFLPGGNIDIPVYSKSTARSIARSLKEKGIIHFALPFRLLSKAIHADRRLQAGLYRLSQRMSLWEVLSALSQGKSELLSLKVPEGFTTEQIAQEMEKLKASTAEEFLKAARDQELLKKLGIHGPSLEGYLFPETYRIPMAASPEALLELMVRQFQDSVGDDFEAKCKVQGLTPYQLVTLASIIEKEAKTDDDRSMIAGVLYNRLRQKIRLQVNAPLNYILSSKNPWVTNEQINTQSPYNTYQHRGLPPTPICNPGLASIQAALAPAQVPYLYYVGKGDGTNLYATTLEEHKKNVIIAKRIRRTQRANSLLKAAGDLGNSK